MGFCVGLDLGQSSDYTALAVVEDAGGSDSEALHLRHLERYPLRTSYPEIADSVARLMRDQRLVKQSGAPTLEDMRNRMSRADALERQRRGEVVRRENPELVVDGTGVGVAVTDLLKERGLRFRPVTITGGDNAHMSANTKVGGRSYRVPKRDLVAALEVPFHTGALKVAEGLALWPALRGELLSFRRKINLRTAHDSYEHWRDSDHDDLVLATALACWWLRRVGRRARPRARGGLPINASDFGPMGYDVRGSD